MNAYIVWISSPTDENDLIISNVYKESLCLAYCTYRVDSFFNITFPIKTYLLDKHSIARPGLKWLMPVTYMAS